MLSLPGEVAQVGESAVWCPEDQVLYWVDVWGQKLFRYDPATSTTISINLPEMAGAVVPAGPGQVLVGLVSAVHRLDIASETLGPAMPPPDHRPSHRFNDATVDPCGRLLIGTMRQSQLGPAEPTGVLYALSQGRWRPLARGFMTINGLALSPDGRTLYLSDSHPSVARIWTCAYDPGTGDIGPMKPFASLTPGGGRPDGAAVDADGFYWIAGVGGSCLHRFHPDGRLDRTIAVPVENPTRPAFGGRDLAQLYLTSMSIKLTRPDPQGLAGRTLLLDPGVCGSRPHSYTG